MATNFGPGSITFGGQTLYSRGDIIVEDAILHAPIQTSIAGTMQQSVTGYRTTINFDHDGRVLSGALALMTKYAGTSIGIGQPIFSDQTLVIHGTAGDKRTYNNAALTTMSALKLSAKAPVYGAMGFTALHKSDMAVATASSLFTDASGAYTQGAYDPANIIMAPFKITWGTTWVDVYAKDGIDLAFQLSLEEDTNDERGICNMLLAGCSVSASFIPDSGNSGPTATSVAALAKLQGTGAGVGTRLKTADSLVMVGGGLTVTMPRAAISVVGSGYGNRRREGMVTMQSSRGITAGALDAALTLALA